jgi:hypothetical protein
MTELKAEFEKKFGKNCPNCDNSGTIVHGYSGDSTADLEQCQFCYCEPLSIFNINTGSSDVWQWFETELTKAKEQKIEDYELALAEVSKVYCELTDNKLSKPNYKAEVILDEIRIQQEKDIEEAENQARIDENERWIATADRLGILRNFVQIDFESRIKELKGEK